VIAYVDASYAVHSDSKSHTSAVILRAHIRQFYEAEVEYQDYVYLLDLSNNENSNSIYGKIIYF
jgi:hypothetical protein